MPKRTQLEPGDTGNSKAAAEARTDSSPAETFRRLANNRVPKAIKAVRLIGNLSRYPHTETQQRNIIDALAHELAGVEKQFTQPRRQTSVDFQVGD